MNADLRIVAVDIGNSAIKLAIGQEQSITEHRICFSRDGWQQDVIGWVKDQLDSPGWHWVIASVRPSAADQLAQSVAEAVPEASIDVITRKDVPMEIEVDHPDQLGIDRLVGAFAAAVQFGVPLVVVDAGSAITVDWVSGQGCFCGGAILPGLKLQSEALARGTEALPPIQWNAGDAIRLPARNTADAIRGGILAGAAATIDALVNRYRLAAGARSDGYQVVLSGGDGPAISNHLAHNHHLMPNLVCRGLLELPRSMQRQAN